MRAVLVGLVVAAFAMPARADGVDLLFMRNAETIAGKVRALQSKRVAVLKFAVKVGDGPARFDAGLANAKLAQKLENALLLARTDDDPMLLTGAAAKAKDLPADTTWQTPEGRAALAHMKGLPLAWDAKQQLSPDLFVSGELAFPKDAAGARLTLYAFTKADPAKLLTIYETRESPDAPPALPSDRNLMSLAGMSFSLDHPAANRIDGDKFAMQQVVAGLKGENAFAKAVQNSPIQLTILARGKGAPTSDDRAMIPETDPKAPGGGRIATPREGDQLTLRLKNAHPTKRFAVVLAVNGKNTNATSKNHELNSLDAKEQKMWVLDPKEEITLRGFSTDAAGGYDPFTVLDDATSEKLFPLMGELYRGLITMHVFAEREAAPLKSTGGTAPPPMNAPAPEPEAEVEMSLVTLGIGEGPLNEVRNSGSPEKAREELEKLTNVRVAGQQLAADPTKLADRRNRGLIAPGQTRRDDGSIQQVEFRLDPSPTAFLQVRYYGR